MIGDVVFAGTHNGVDIEIVSAGVPQSAERMLLSCRAMVSLNHIAYDNPAVSGINLGHRVRGGPWVFDEIDGSRIGQWIEFYMETSLLTAYFEVRLLVDALEVMQLRADEKIRYLSQKFMQGDCDDQG